MQHWNFTRVAGCRRGRDSRFIRSTFTTSSNTCPSSKTGTAPTSHGIGAASSTTVFTVFTVTNTNDGPDDNYSNNYDYGTAYDNHSDSYDYNNRNAHYNNGADNYYDIGAHNHINDNNSAANYDYIYDNFYYYDDIRDLDNDDYYFNYNNNFAEGVLFKLH